MKIGLMIYLVNDRQNNNSKRPYHAIRELAQQAEADGFDSIWLADQYAPYTSEASQRITEALQLYRAG